MPVISATDQEHDRESSAPVPGAALDPVEEPLSQAEAPPVPPPPDVPAGEERVRKAKPLPEVKPPTAAEEARHRLTHIPYRRWCRWCVMARMLNTPHRRLPPFSREIPLIVFD